MNDDTYRRLADAVEVLRERAALQPRLAVVLGSGLSALAGEVTDGVEIPYGEIPHFPVSTAPGHFGKLILGRLEGLPAAVLSGRAHLYEGYEPEQVVFPVRTMRLLGAEALIITNAAGGVNPDFHSGALMLISDHINFTGHNPLVGPNDSRLGLRFPDMSQAYDPELRLLAHRVSHEVSVPVEEGVYLGLLGPSFETPAEIRMARLLGADAVGMSTVMEVIAAHHAGMRVLGISCITNMAAGILPQKLTEEEVFESVNRVSQQFVTLVRGIIKAVASGV